MDINQVQLFFSAIFNPEDLISTTFNYTGVFFGSSLEHNLTTLYYTPASENRGLVCALNPYKNLDCARGKQNMVTRNILIEFDSGSREEQYNFLHASGMPFTTVVWSGNRSLHVVIALEDALSETEYNYTFKRICVALDRQNDAQTGNPSLFTRVPSFRRGEQMQELVEIRKKVNIHELRCFYNSPKNAKKWEVSPERHAIQEAKRVKPKFISSGINPVTFSVESYLSELRIDKLTPNGQIYVQCPCCDEEGSDKSCSNLSVRMTDEGKFLLHCFGEHSYLEISSLLKKRYPLKQQA